MQIQVRVERLPETLVTAVRGMHGVRSVVPIWVNDYDPFSQTEPDYVVRTCLMVVRSVSDKNGCHLYTRIRRLLKGAGHPHAKVFVLDGAMHVNKEQR